MRPKSSYLLNLSMVALFCVVALLFTPLSVIAQNSMQTMVIEDDVALYRQPRSGLEPVYILRLGDEVRVSERVVRGYRKVEYAVYGKKQKAYARDVELLGRGPSWQKKAVIKKSSFFISGIYSKQEQGARELQTNADSIYNVGEFEGDSQFLALGYDWYLNKRLTVRVGYVMRTVLIEGQATQQGSSTVYKFELEQKYHGFLVGLKYSGMNWAGWSVMGELEYDKSYDQSFRSVSGPAVDDSQLKDVTNLTMGGVLLYTYVFNRRFAIEPALRIGSIVSAQPYILLTEGQVSAHYLW